MWINRDSTWTWLVWVVDSTRTRLLIFFNDLDLTRTLETRAWTRTRGIVTRLQHCNTGPIFHQSFLYWLPRLSARCVNLMATPFLPPDTIRITELIRICFTFYLQQDIYYIRTGIQPTAERLNNFFFSRSRRTIDLSWYWRYCKIHVVAQCHTGDDYDTGIPPTPSRQMF